MTEIFDKEKLVEIMFDPVTSQILSELEHGEKESSHLASVSLLTEDEIHEQLKYLIEHDFIKTKTIGGKVLYEADGEKLSQIIENDENFSSTIDGLTKLDSYLN